MTELKFSDTREKELDLAGYECRFCGVSDEQHREDCGKGLNVHHVLPRSAGGSDNVNNLLAVCNACHQTIEHSHGKAMAVLKEQVESEKSTEEETESRERAAYRAGWRERELQKDCVLAWLDDVKIPLTIAQFGTFKPDTKLYSDREEAARDFEEYDGSVQLETTTVDASDIFEKNLRVSSTTGVELLTSGYDKSDSVGGVTEPDKTSVLSTDIPIELKSDTEQ